MYFLTGGAPVYNQRLCFTLISFTCWF